MKRKYDVYAIGNALVDYEIEVNDQFLSQNQIEKSLMTLVDESHQQKILDAVSGNIKKKQSGGSAANSVVALAQLGGTGYYACKVANDTDGHFFFQDMTSYGIDSNLHPATLATGVTGKCLIMITADAERTMNTFLGITTNFSVAELNESALANSQYLFIEGYLISSETGRQAMKQAKIWAEQHGVKVALTFSDPSMVKYFGNEMKELVGQHVDLLFCNEEEALLFTGTETMGEARQALKNVTTHFVITQGKNGAMIWDGETFIDIEPYPVTALDSTGAGDMFAGAFLYGITKGHSMASSGRLASKLSSEVVAQFGPRLSHERVHAVHDLLLKK